MHSVLVKVELLLVVPGHQITNPDRRVLTLVLCLPGTKCWHDVSALHGSLFNGLEFVFMYIDNVLITSRTKQEHAGHLQEVLC